MMMVKLKQWLIFFFFSWLRGGEEYFKEAWLATKTWIIKRVLSQAIVPHVKFTWNFCVILVWRALARISREIFHMNFMWKGFPVKTVWKSCELSHEFYVKLLYVNSLHTNSTWFSDETSRKNHMKLFSREAQLAVLCIKKYKIMQNGQLKTVSLLFRRTSCLQIQ